MWCLLIVKNYTGDRINFGLAAEKAKSEGFKMEVAGAVLLQHMRVYLLKVLPWEARPLRQVAGKLFKWKCKE
ncbi:unnamed protein product [Urochloa humidicola]